MGNASTWQTWTQAAANVAVVVTLIFVWLQLLASQKQLELAQASSWTQQFFELVRHLDERRDDREQVFRVSEREHGIPKSWEGKELEAADRVCASFDLAGILAQQSPELESLIVRNWHYSAARCFEILEPRLSHYRQTRGEPYWDNFDFLVEKIREYNRGEGARRARAGRGISGV